MKVVKYNKLVRDKIPEIVKAAGWTPVISVLKKKDFLKVLKAKLVEEAKELLAAKSKKDVAHELADLQEVLDTIIAEVGLTKVHVQKIQREKNKKRGGFKKRIFLVREEK